MCHLCATGVETPLVAPSRPSTLGALVRVWGPRYITSIRVTYPRLDQQEALPVEG